MKGLEVRPKCAPCKYVLCEAYRRISFWRQVCSVMCWELCGSPFVSGNSAESTPDAMNGFGVRIEPP